MLHVVLYQPEIPPNTGNIIRLCANTGHMLHLIGPLGFDLQNKQARRAGLDYHELARVYTYDHLDAFVAQRQPKRIFALSTKGKTCYTDPHFEDEDALLFGPETRGLPNDLLQTFPHHHRLRIPMQPESRSLNLSNAVAIVLYEAWRQLQFASPC